MDNIDVRPGTGATKVSVATDDIGGTHYPIYKVSFGDLGVEIPVDSYNPLPVTAVISELPDLTYKTDSLIVLNEISNKLDVLIKYWALFQKVDLSEDS